ncbi:MAG: hypothetical protein K5776_05130 [Lachnospiraceae bacterium]|nr:hypothetical protein [Lachnospiraceae bacterium]
MGLFKSKYEKAMDDVINKIRVNMSNNYKDAAQDNLAEFEKLFNSLCEEGKIKDKTKENYSKILDEYKEKMKGYTHKDQKPYWT